MMSESMSMDLVQVTSGEDVKVIAMDDNSFTLPSVVALIGTDQYIVGSSAKK